MEQAGPAREIATFHEFLETSRARTNIVYGGGGSGKSRSVGQFLFKKFLNEDNKRFLIAQKTGPALRDAAYHLMVKEVMPEYGFADEEDGMDLNKSDLTLTFGTNEMDFRSLDDPKKKKSINYNYIWMEEATDFTLEDYRILNMYLRSPEDGGQNQMFLTFNPIDQFHWCITQFVYAQQQDNLLIHHSTYKDNPFLPEASRREYENLINQDENYYRIYTLGEPGVLENTIYKNYTTGTAQFHYFKDSVFGIDFGYNNQSAIIEIYMQDNVPYIRELLYQSHLTNSELIDKLKALGVPTNAPIYADSAEPQRIAEIASAGFNIFPADKSVKDGIDFVKRFRLQVHPDSPNLLAELRSYSYMKDKNGIVKEEPVKFRDHLMDSLRYALFTHYGKQHAVSIPKEWIGFGGTETSEGDFHQYDPTLGF